MNKNKISKNLNKSILNAHLTIMGKLSTFKFILFQQLKPTGTLISIHYTDKI